MPQRRQLAAILFTDMIGYTALMSRDEALARRLRDRHREVLRSSHEQHSGEILQYFGDGTLSIFGSAVEATQCAIHIQRALQKDPKVPLRIGIHSGEIVWDEEGIYGSAVNVASRLESFAVEGAILISSKVRDELANKPDFQFQSLGIFELKNVPQPMEIFAVANEGVAVPAPVELEGKGKFIDATSSGFDPKAAPWPPEAPGAEEPASSFPQESQSGVVVNDILIDVICEDLAIHSKDLDDELNKETLDIPSIKREIVDAFPTPIGEQLRILFTRSSNPRRPDEMELFTPLRLMQLAVAYRTTLQFISFILLSQLWDEKHSREDLKMTEGQMAKLADFCALDAQNFQSFDFADLINVIIEIFDRSQVSYFIEEFSRLKIHSDHNPGLHEAHRFMSNLREELPANKIPADQLEEQCLLAEEHLGVLLKEVAFLVKHKLVTIKNIEIVKSRHELARFRHRQITLNRALTVASTGVAEVGVDFDNYADNKSVIFLKADQHEINDYLNLTPFIIDENALNSDYSSKIFLFAYRVRDAYYYQFLNNPNDRPLIVNERRYPGIKNQFDRFQADIFGRESSSDGSGHKPSGGSRFLRKR